MTIKSHKMRDIEPEVAGTMAANTGYWKCLIEDWIGVAFGVVF